MLPRGGNADSRALRKKKYLEYLALHGLEDSIATETTEKKEKEGMEYSTDESTLTQVSTKSTQVKTIQATHGEVVDELLAN
jgi:hypothetical protein